MIEYYYRENKFKGGVNMKLVIAMVQDDDALDLVDAITEAGFRVTKLATNWRVFKIR